ncbi:hypothetical protein OEZ86_013648 [Tetradesmus obliquus]|nr:hypothetical protein OEZ86_013648 [Tetradesmus obliquus]
MPQLWEQLEEGLQQLWRELKQDETLKIAGLYEWGVTLKAGTTAADLARVGVLAKGRLREPGRILCFYVGEAGGRPGSKQNLKTRFGEYALTSTGEIGPRKEQDKFKLFQGLQAAGGQLWFRWRVVAPAKFTARDETLLLQHFCYAANLRKNGKERIRALLLER